MRLARILGIDVIVHPSWLFVFAFVTWSLSSDIGPWRHLELSQYQRIVLGVLGALLLFLSVLVHELAHSLAARRSGLRVKGITLFLFGGVSSFEDEPRGAPASAWISVAGPLANFALAGTLFAAIALDALSAPLSTLFRYLAGANVMLGVFNLLPAYPLDGGRLLHALLWRRTGDRTRATVISARIGRVFALLFIGFGIYETFAAGFGSGLWMTFVGWFLLQAAAVEESQALIATLLRGHDAAELASVTSDALPADATAADAVAAMLGSGNGAIPVQLGGRCIGVVTKEDLAKLGRGDLDGAYVTALMTRIDDLERVADALPATDALERLKQSGRSVIGVIDAEGNVIGFLGHDGILRFLAAQTRRAAQLVAAGGTSRGRSHG